MHRQLGDAVRDAIVQGRLRSGTRLPSTRALGRDLSVSRNTILEAFGQLRAEGYLEARIGSGTYVAATLPERAMTVGSKPRRSNVARIPATLSRQGRLLRSTRSASRQPSGAGLAFDPDTPANELFPVELWRRLTARRWSCQPEPAVLRHDQAGYAPLREAIAQYVCMTRGLTCEPEQVVVIGGERQGLDLAARTLADPGDRAWFEDPGSPHARDILSLAGAEIVPVPVDEDGIDIAAGIRKASDARIAYVSPSAQYPLVRTLSPERRAALLEWATSHDAWVLENDRESEFRYSGRPLPALRGMDAGRVVYMGSFGRVLAPAVRLAYLVVPPPLVDVFAAARSLTQDDVPVMEQAVLADFLLDGHFSRHLRRLRATHDHRRGFLLEQLEARLGGLLEIAAEPAGMHIVAHLPEALADVAISARCAAMKLIAPALSTYALDRADLNGLLLGFAGHSDPAIRYGAKRLEVILSEASEASWAPTAAAA